VKILEDSSLNKSHYTEHDEYLKEKIKFRCYVKNTLKYQERECFAYC